MLVDEHELDQILANLPTEDGEQVSLSQLLDLVRAQVRSIRQGKVAPLDLHLGDDEAWARSKALFLDSVMDQVPLSQSAFGGELVCFQCQGQSCNHGLPTRPDEVFIRYTPNGKPLFQSFSDVVLREQPKLADKLFGSSSTLITYVISDPQAKDPLLPEVKQQSERTLIGVLHIGFLRSDALSTEVRTAVSVVMFEFGGRYELQVVGLNELSLECIRALPDSDHLKMLETAFRSARRKIKRLMRQRRANIANQKMSPIAILNQLGAVMRRINARGQSRTHHAKKRHAQGGRPTGQAFRDARQVTPVHLLFDERRRTYVVLGRRSRAHLFSARGKHVTSIRLQQGELERKKSSGRWRATSTEDFARFSSMLPRD